MPRSQELDMLGEVSTALTIDTARVFSSLKGDARHLAPAREAIASSRELMAEVDGVMARR
jgi:hypothetical protein